MTIVSVFQGFWKLVNFSGIQKRTFITLVMRICKILVHVLKNLKINSKSYHNWQFCFFLNGSVSICLTVCVSLLSFSMFFFLTFILPILLFNLINNPLCRKFTQTENNFKICICFFSKSTCTWKSRVKSENIL